MVGELAERCGAVGGATDMGWALSRCYRYENALEKKHGKKKMYMARMEGQDWLVLNSSGAWTHILYTCTSSYILLCPFFCFFRMMNNQGNAAEVKCDARFWVFQRTSCLALRG